MAAAPDPYAGGVVLQAGVSDNAVRITSDDAGNEFLIEDHAGVRVWAGYPGDDGFCEQGSRTKVRCRLFEPGGISAALGDGDDAIYIRSTQRGPVSVGGDPGHDTIVLSNPQDSELSSINGGDGGDRLIGGQSGDQLRGAAGADVVKGKGGDDLLYGDHGPDALRGGSGDDFLDARAQDTDHSIRCGAGDDIVVIDRHLDPNPVGCERIHRR